MTLAVVSFGGANRSRGGRERGGKGLVEGGKGLLRGWGGRGGEAKFATTCMVMQTNANFFRKSLRWMGAKYTCTSCFFCVNDIHTTYVVVFVLHVRLYTKLFNWYNYLTLRIV